MSARKYGRLYSRRAASAASALDASRLKNQIPGFSPSVTYVRTFSSRKLETTGSGNMPRARRAVAGSRSSLAPSAQGSYGSGLDGTRIGVRMRLLRPVAAFMAAWLTFAAVFVVRASIAAAHDPLRLGFVVLALAFFSVGYGCMSVLFWLEARRTRAKLEELLA